MLKFDELLFQKTGGQIGKPFEQAIQQIGGFEENENIFGSIIPLQQILFNKTEAAKAVFQQFTPRPIGLDICDRGAHHFPPCIVA